MAIRWDELDDQDDEDLWWAALLAEPPYGSPPGILERLERERPAWHTRAACRGAGVNFFDPGQVEAAQALCAACEVRDDCAASGRREPAGVWGGQLRGAAARITSPTRVFLTPSTRADARPAPLFAPPPCSDCGERPARSKGLCPRCSLRARRRAAGAQPRRKGKLVAACSDCGDERPIQGRGLCARCHSRDLRRRAGVQPKRVGRKVIACGDCGTVGLIQGQGLCRTCYSRARRRARVK